jgi:ribosomal protein S18 acetylase RimI-like enzyme
MKRLKWDSDFWGIEIFNIDEDDSFYQHGYIEDKIIKSRDDYMIQALVSDSFREQINLLEQKNFRFVESKITLKKTVNYPAELESRDYKTVSKKELFDYKNYFYDLYANISRYQLLKKDKINEFYYTWVLNSIDGSMDDTCIGYYAGDQLAGFITYKTKINITYIGLLGVFPQFQKRGISQKLLNFLNNEVINKGLNEISVSTQGKNIKAINAYIKNGFYFDNIKHWYYLKGKQYDKV